MARPARITTGSRELKTRLGTYLDLVRQGTVITVTDRGKPVAQLGPLPQPAEHDAETALDLLAEQGLLTRPTRAPLPLAERAPLLDAPGKPLSALVIEDREDRF